MAFPYRILPGKGTGKKINEGWAGNLAQGHKPLPGKHEVVRSIPGTTKRKKRKKIKESSTVSPPPSASACFSLPRDVRSPTHGPGVLGGEGDGGGKEPPLGRRRIRVLAAVVRCFLLLQNQKA